MVSTFPFAPLFAFVAMVLRNGGVSFRRVPMFLSYLARFTLLEPFRLVERLAYDEGIDAHTLQHPPIFILGHWRSGTSFLQTLLTRDPRFTSSTIYRSFFSDSFYVTESWLKPLLNALSRGAGLQFSIQRIPLHFDIPAEGDVGLCSLLSPYSYSWGHIFPTRFAQWLERVVVSPDHNTATGWIQAYDYFIRKLSYRSGGKRIVMKSPGDSARIRLLLRQYPDARFVYIRRDPTEVFHSNLYLWRVIQRENGLQTLSDEQVEDLVIEHYRSLLSSYLRQKKNVPAGQLVETEYADLRENPVVELTKIYDTLDLGDIPQPALEAFLRTQPPYQVPTYTTPPELRARLATEWSCVL